MNLQYILDNTGKTTGVFIPISAWNELKDRYKDINDRNQGSGQGRSTWQFC